MGGWPPSEAVFTSLPDSRALAVTTAINTDLCTQQVLNKRSQRIGYRALPWAQPAPRAQSRERTSVHLLSSAMLPTRVASKDCSMVLSSDWLNMGSSPGLLVRCGSRWRFRLSGRQSTPAGGGNRGWEENRLLFFCYPKEGCKTPQTPLTASNHTRVGTAKEIREPRLCIL